MVFAKCNKNRGDLTITCTGMHASGDKFCLLKDKDKKDKKDKGAKR